MGFREFAADRSFSGNGLWQWDEKQKASDACNQRKIQRFRCLPLFSLTSFGQDHLPTVEPVDFDRDRYDHGLSLSSYSRLTTTLGDTDLDVIVDGVYFQVKSSVSALKRQIKPPAPSTDPVEWIRSMDNWIGKAKNDMVSKGLPVKIRGYVPNFLDVPQQLKDHVTMLRRQGLDINWVSEIGFVKNW
jgi:hypothetical protein